MLRPLGVHLSTEENEFVDNVSEELHNFLTRSSQGPPSVLLFPPLTSRLRFLIHRLVEETVSLSSFSVGAGAQRRTAVCLSDLRLPPPLAEQPGLSYRGGGRRGGGQSPRPCPTLAGQPGNQGRPGSGKGRKKPDRALYVPRAQQGRGTKWGRREREGLCEGETALGPPPHYPHRGAAAQTEEESTKRAAPGGERDQAAVEDLGEDKREDKEQREKEGSGGGAGDTEEPLGTTDTINSKHEDREASIPKVPAQNTDPQHQQEPEPEPARPEGGEHTAGITGGEVGESCSPSDPAVPPDRAGTQASYPPKSGPPSADLLQELSACVREPGFSIAEMLHDYSSPQWAPPDLAGPAFTHILEIHDFPAELGEESIHAAFTAFRERGFRLEWVDEGHILALFSSPESASEALSISHEQLKTRPLCQASQASQAKAIKRAEFLQPVRDRPRTDTLLAHRLVSRALGLEATESKEPPQPHGHSSGKDPSPESVNSDVSSNKTVDSVGE
ncbi:R3H and coiled-coil domain-containing protein 1 [Callorhinchus milii]|uniref:R3H and coiled-coil domain-containing protein 1 n=1 Tax=Callorhinchus milii TaxID=7868 RepID=UPI001C3F698C|nr:R3H and coiled-coil domain-containing protein 1 [Callorhinchus milii]XP_042200520.1 R3H and coiled-coil domain-containing protein 1 [Callorhinchus milii]XP_042200521.1 R3H and coiled-coil domain-containing protein 1 [Callorhinchus milii]XP_042200522.1 R3H and coiled-coil domain-containing protein 1 [Callorhinchus milii]